MIIPEDNKHVFIDTNILVFANVVTSPFHSQAKAKLIEINDYYEELCISNQVIREYLAILSRPDINGKKIADELLINDVKRLRTEYNVLFESNLTLDNLQMLLSTCFTGGKQIHDANIVATMISNKIKTLLTHNVNDFVRFNSFISLITI